jgi:transglutaminase/protease-like cytokinesis protein 3
MRSRVSYFIIVITCFTGYDGFSQVDLRNYDYSKVDAHARGITYKELDKLSQDITRGLTKDHEKVRAIFAWITANIEYDTKAFHRASGPVTFTYSSEEELQQLLAEQNEKTVLNVLNKQRGVCDGYARLFKFLCEKNGISCEIINGYARNNPNSIGEEQPGSNHSWNAVLLNQKWYLIDPTWGSGYTDPGVTSFTRDFRPGYFLTPPDKFILDHFPDDPEWQLMNRQVSRKEFFNLPLTKAGFLKFNISDYSPKSGIIKARKGEPIEFEFTSDQKINEILVHQQNEVYSEKANYTKKGNRYQFPFTPEQRGSYILTIFLDEESMIMYKMEVR